MAVALPTRPAAGGGGTVDEDSPPVSVVAASGGITLTAGVYYRDAVIDASGLGSANLFVASGADEIVVENVRVTGLANTKTAFSFTNCDHVSVRNCVIESGGKGITFDACNDVEASGNEIVLTTDGDSGFIGHGILFYANAAAHARAVITGNKVTAAGSFSHGIYGWGSNSATLAGPVYASDIVVADNVINGAEGGIWFSKCQRVAVTGNTVRDCNDVGIDFEGCLDCSASGNSVADARAGALAALYNSRRIVFAGNQVTAGAYSTVLGGGHLEDTSWLCAYVRDTCEDIDFVGNSFTSTAASRMGEANVWRNAETAASLRVSFRGNSFANCCIQVNGQMDGLLIDGNSFYADYVVGDVFIAVAQSRTVTITNNRIALASDSAQTTRVWSPILVVQNDAATTIRVTDVLIEGNKIRNHPSVGITVNTYNGTDYTATFVVRNNEAGVIFTRTSKASTHLITGNVVPTDPSATSTSTTW